jgi:hypothetical protein
MTRFKPGDIIVCKRFPGVRRRIVEVYEGPVEGDVENNDVKEYYDWEYPDLPSGERNLFLSLNSNNPELEMWTKEENGTEPTKR